MESRSSIHNDDLPLGDFGEVLDEIKKTTTDVSGRKSTLKGDDGEGHTHFSFILYIILVTTLVFVWGLYALFLWANPERVQKYHLVAIKPNETIQYKLSNHKIKKTVGIQMIGPFVHGQDVTKTRPTDLPQLFCFISAQKAIEEEEIVLRKPWSVVIVQPKVSLFTVTTELFIDMTLDKDLVLLRKEMESNTHLDIHLNMHTNIKKPIAIKLLIDPYPINKDWGIALGTLVLILLYVLIIFELINRTLAAVIVSTLSLGVLAYMDNRPSTSEIIEWIDIETLLLLFGMMILVSVLSESGIFDYLSVWAYQIAKGNMWTMITVLCVSVGILSAILDNVTMMLLLTPVTTRLCEVTNLNPVNVLMGMVVISNIGAALTPVGDPPNIIIMNNAYINEAAKVNFGNFILHMAPGVFIGLIIGQLQIRCLYMKKNKFMNKESPEIEAIRHQINVWERAAQHMAPTTTDEEVVQNTLLQKAEVLKKKLATLSKSTTTHVISYEETLAQMKANYPIRNMSLLIKATIAFIFVITLFFMHAIPNIKHVPLGWSALLGALLILIIADEENIDNILSKVEWSTLLFFACLFILMESLSKLGLIEVLGHFVINIILMVDKEYQLLMAIILIVWVTGLASAFLNNIPVVTMMVRIVVHLCKDDELKLPPQPLVWALAFGACFGGNGTLLGASANVVASGMAEQHGYPFTFIQFFIYAFPIMLSSLVICTIYLLLAHCAFTWH